MKKKGGINPDLEDAISKLLKTVLEDKSMDLEQRLKVIDRAINLEKLKQKISDDEWGSGFSEGDDA